MSTFGSVMADAFGCLGDQFGTSVVYRAPNADDATLTALVGESRHSFDDGPAGQIVKRLRTVTFSVADVSEVNPLATVVIGNEVWAVTETGSRATEAMTRLECVFVEKTEFTAKGFRRS